MGGWGIHSSPNSCASKVSTSLLPHALLGCRACVEKSPVALEKSCILVFQVRRDTSSVCHRVKRVGLQHGLPWWVFEEQPSILTTKVPLRPGLDASLHVKEAQCESPDTSVLRRGGRGSSMALCEGHPVAGRRSRCLSSYLSLPLRRQREHV